jgi:hypothetical protein
MPFERESAGIWPPDAPVTVLRRVDDFGLYTVTARPERGVDSFAGECPKNRTGEDPQ